jgi:DNA-binding MarR family transcriptional regulator
MQAEGLVVREHDPDDGRAVQIVTTRAGRSRYRRASDVYAPAVQRLVGKFVTPEQCRALVALLAQVGGPGGAGDGTDAGGVAAR